jgi:hypothetical protein
MPNPPSLAQILQEGKKVVDELVKVATPILKVEFALSQVLGKMMASQNDCGPPPTYYINDPDPASPHPTGTKAQNPERSPGLFLA